MSDRTFIEDVLSGDAQLDDIDSYVEAWHLAADDKSLPEYLGLEEAEYALWVEQPDVPEFLVHAKRFELQTDAVVSMREAHLIAARSAQAGDFEVLRDWLQRRGTI